MRTKSEIEQELEVLKTMDIPPTNLGYIVRRLWAVMALRWVLEDDYGSPSTKLKERFERDVVVELGLGKGGKGD